MSVHRDFYTAYDMHPDDADQRIRFLMRRFAWCKLEAESYFYYEPYDEEDWCDYE